MNKILVMAVSCMLVLALSTMAWAVQPSKVLSGISTTQNYAKSWDNFERMSITGTFENISTGAIYIMESANNGTSYIVLQGYSTTTPWKYDLDTTKGLRTNIKLQYTNKSIKVPKAKANVWILVE